MKKVKIMFFCICFSVIGFPQGAGNWWINQQLSFKKTKSFDEYSIPQQEISLPAPQKIFVDSIYEITVNVLFNAPADEYIMILGTFQLGETIENSHELINKRISSFVSSIKNFGITDKDIFIDFIAQYPIFEIEVEKKLFSKATYQEVPAGFEIRKNIHIRYKSQNQAEKLIVEAAKNEIYDVVRVDYIVNNIQQIYDSLRTVGSKIMQEKKKLFKTLDVSTNAYYITIDENIRATYPIERYSTFTDFVRISGSS